MTLSTEMAVTSSSRLPTVELLTFKDGGCFRMVLVPTVGVIVDLDPLGAPMSDATRTYELALRKELARGRFGRSRDILPSSSSMDRTDRDEAGRRTGVAA